MALDHAGSLSWSFPLLFVWSALEKPFIQEVPESARNVIKTRRARYEGPMQAPPVFDVIKHRWVPGDPPAITLHQMTTI